MPAGNLVATGYYTRNSYKLTVTFVNQVTDGSLGKLYNRQWNGTDGDGHGRQYEILVPYQSTCVVTAPTVSGYKADNISVTMGAADVNRSISYSSTSTGDSGSPSGGSTTKNSDTITTTNGAVDLGEHYKRPEGGHRRG
jgi:hypothetical protein